MRLSLRLRLVLGGMAWTASALIIAGFVVVLLFDLAGRRHLQDEMEGAISQLVALIEPSAGAPTLADALSDPRYSLPYGGAYWQVSGPSGIIRSNSLWDAGIPVESAEDKMAEARGPDGQRILTLTRQAIFGEDERNRRYWVTVAVNYSQLESETVRFARDLVPALAVLAVALFGATWLQVELGLRPLRRLRRSLQAVRTGGETRLDDAHPEEVLPLVHEVNELLDSKDEFVRSARANAADLVHGLKTPLSALMATANRMEQDGQAGRAESIRELAEQMSDRIDYQLRLSRLRPAAGAVAVTGSLNSVLVRAMGVLRKTARGETILWKVELAKDAAIKLDQHDLLEVVGVVLENATKWAGTRVDITTRLAGNTMTVAIEDDGPGLSSGAMAELGVRGRRFNDVTPGSGLGLAIASEILEANQGTISYEQSKLGGLKVSLAIPVAEMSIGSRDHLPPSSLGT